MGDVTITVPDELLYRARQAGLNLSRVTAIAIIEELRRQEDLAALDAFVDEIDAGLGRPPQRERLRPTAAWESEPLPERPAPEWPPDGGGRPG
ncbi:MAG: type II toxin-antitoxin system CcdA family antitoxin [Acidimicrobiaceae bacterium]|nr:type II toxin-antitoxin system CcdA family antitoxin [Acidimicrobiaceae bacterium]